MPLLQKNHAIVPSFCSSEEASCLLALDRRAPHHHKVEKLTMSAHMDIDRHVAKGGDIEHYRIISNNPETPPPPSPQTSTQDKMIQPSHCEHACRHLVACAAEEHVACHPLPSWCSPLRLRPTPQIPKPPATERRAVIASPPSSTTVVWICPSGTSGDGKTRGARKRMEVALGLHPRVASEWETREKGKRAHPLPQLCHKDSQYVWLTKLI